MSFSHERLRLYTLSEWKSVVDTGGGVTTADPTLQQDFLKLWIQSYYYELWIRSYNFYTVIHILFAFRIALTGHLTLKKSPRVFVNCLVCWEGERTVVSSLKWMHCRFDLVNLIENKTEKKKNITRRGEKALIHILSLKERTKKTLKFTCKFKEWIVVSFLAFVLHCD